MPGTATAPVDDALEDQPNVKLLKYINSPQFSLYSCIELLCKHANNVGIHYYLCQKLLTFPHSELQFYIPQLVQVLLTIESESLALEDLLLKLRGENPHFALLTFWQLQALLTDLSTDPASYGFQVARRVLNALQQSLFSISDEEPKVEKMHENVAPALVLSSMMMSCMAFPPLTEYTKPLIESQGKRQKSYVFKLARNAMKDLTKNLTLKNTLLNKALSKSAKRKSLSGSPSFASTGVFTSPAVHSVDLVEGTKSREDVLFRKPKNRVSETTVLDFNMVDDVGNQVYEEKISTSIRLPKRKSKYMDGSFVHRTYEDKAIGENQSTPAALLDDITERGATDTENETDLAEESDGDATERPDLANHTQFTNSMPDLHQAMRVKSMTPLKKVNSEKPSIKRSSTQPESHYDQLRKRENSKDLVAPVDISTLSTTKKIKMLKANYFRCETQFAIALESISQRLAQVPTEARLSALRAELSLMNRDLPAEVDIPTLLPLNKKGKLHRLVLITASEAQVLNSAEKVPYLLLIEYLRDDFDFDPMSETNEAVLRKSSQSNAPLFDLNYLNRKRDNNDFVSLGSPFSVSSGILGENGNSAAQTEQTIATSSIPSSTGEMDLGDMSMIKIKNQTDAEAYRKSAVLQTAGKVPMLPENKTKRSRELDFVSDINDVVTATDGVSRRNSKEAADETDALAEQMRLSSLMLNQLKLMPPELANSSNEIMSDIISSMQQVQDKFGYRDLEAIDSKAGERRLENDMMTGGIDTSYLGEDWQTKKERIRRTSEYGHLENWDLCSVIAKSGDDLRQEAFACQMIQAMAQIWTIENTDIWVKKMKILITSATTGLVETITNAMSVHSIKKSLSNKLLDDKDNKEGRIVTIQDHFICAFGGRDDFRFRRAQDNFASSLAAYSLICYILQVKDRHNGNIMIDNEGHVVHIDFGFMLSNSPGSVGFEAAPFKLTQEYVDLMDGPEGKPYKKFVRLMKSGFKALRKHSSQIVSMCEIMQKDNMQPCFAIGDQTSVQLGQRFHLELKDEEVDDFVENFLIGKSLKSMYTRLYDQFQLITQGIYS
ncbi:1-phosphatidylinositol 4-kinase KNAG_0F00490 [Huiozyma naganishii CBS 8797]|uniref:1-phosphatidylinositol 4-kinase n=1 Tax=Huiozyma naganishii (strain ATCC MYA-139 / BCRC 22969 / CBS 8797 / KCTC 17520 / NBRC 10181 / NCYC 3082 / Yp74L-3) TaxID=1071383 RepID=J7RME3_HUIN7|nr:hypothetical protein KNAG_0F00490 [Kazachstania naganishii CBS 8797]CCK70718.1 hypothetical protein KNAG_0F00490 [Kazachstania naganishii CBS 8797]